MRVGGLHSGASFDRLGLSQSDSKSPATTRKELTMSDLVTIFDSFVAAITGLFNAGVEGISGIVDSFANLSS